MLSLSFSSLHSSHKFLALLDLHIVVWGRGVIGVVDALEGEAAVYIRFTERRAAAKALVDLEGRFFAGQKISCAFFDEARFEAKEFG